MRRSRHGFGRCTNYSQTHSSPKFVSTDSVTTTAALSFVLRPRCGRIDCFLFPYLHNDRALTFDGAPFEIGSRFVPTMNIHCSRSELNATNISRVGRPKFPYQSLRKPSFPYSNVRLTRLDRTSSLIKIADASLRFCRGEDVGRRCHRCRRSSLLEPQPSTY